MARQRLAAAGAMSSSILAPLCAVGDAPCLSVDADAGVEERLAADTRAQSDDDVSPVLHIPANGRGDASMIAGTAPPPAATPDIATSPAAPSADATSTEPPDFPGERPPPSGYTLFVIEFNKTARDKVRACALLHTARTHASSAFA